MPSRTWSPQLRAPRLGTVSAWSKRRCFQRSMEFTVNDRKNQQHQHRNDRNGYNPICSHPMPHLLAKDVLTISPRVKRDQIPTRHPPQRLHTPVHVPLALQQRPPRMLDRLSLHL